MAHTHTHARTHTHRGHTHIYMQTHLSLFGSFCWVHANIVSHAPLFTAASGGGVSERPWNVCYWLLPNTWTNAILFRATLTASTSLLKCWWFILRAIFTPAAGIRMRMEDISEWIIFFHIDLNEAALTPKATKISTCHPLLGDPPPPVSLFIACRTPPLTLLLFHSDSPQKCLIIYIASFI